MREKIRRIAFSLHPLDNGQRFQRRLEHGCGFVGHYPDTVHSIFCAHAWVLEQLPELLLKYADLSWLARGDWFYMHKKLAKTIKAFRGVKWKLAAH